MTFTSDQSLHLQTWNHITCILGFTETWLGDSDLYSNLILSGSGSPIQMDWLPEITRKCQDGGVCSCINQRYCNCGKREDMYHRCGNYCLFLFVHSICHANFSSSFTHSCISRANASAVAQLISDVTHELDSICPEAPKLKTLKIYEQYVTTTQNTILNLYCGSVNGAYKSLPVPSFGGSNHSSVLYILRLYTSILQTSGAEGENCKNLVGGQKLLPPRTGLIIPSKKVISHPNNKALVMTELKNKIESQYCSGDPQVAWRGIKSMASITQSSCETRQGIHANVVDDGNLTSCWNSYFSCSERSGFVLVISQCKGNYHPHRVLLKCLKRRSFSRR